MLSAKAMQGYSEGHGWCRLFVIGAALVLVACQRDISIKLEYEVPQALVEQSARKVGIFFPPKFSAAAYHEESDERGTWYIDLGSAQVAMFNKVLGDLFANLEQLPSLENLAVDIALVPHLNKVQFATPQESGFEHFESWVEYRIEFVNQGGSVEPWLVSGYGQAQAPRFGSNQPGIETALKQALRNVAAKIATGLPKNAQLQSYFGSTGQ
tara:strand:- start:415 stop:1047 length:633 start_codon:yes stop_codon:yes gene_type:complete